MTAIAIWCNNEVSRSSLWVAADSRISNLQSVLLEDGAKIFSLPIICRSPGVDGFFSEISYQHTVGYCFAGSTLIGQNTFLSILPLLGNLISHPGYVVPLAEVANFIHAYLLRTFNDYRQTATNPSLAEIAVFGHCHATSKVCVFHFKPVVEQGLYTISYTSNLDMKSNDFIYLGDMRSEVTSRISNAITADPTPGRPQSRAPRYVIEECIQDQHFPTIGGDLQLGIADSDGFRAYSICKPRVRGAPEAYISYLGREITPDIRQVGEAAVGGWAIV